jgi:hypothetical protein
MVSGYNLVRLKTHPLSQCLWMLSMSSPVQAWQWGFRYRHQLYGSARPSETETSPKFNRRVIGGMVLIGWGLLIFVLTRANL